MRISDWSSDVCSSDLNTSSACCWRCRCRHDHSAGTAQSAGGGEAGRLPQGNGGAGVARAARTATRSLFRNHVRVPLQKGRSDQASAMGRDRSEEHTSELQSLMRISYAVFCLKKKKIEAT